MFKTLDALTPRDESEAGGKAYTCARLKQAGFPVPDGIVVPACASDAEIAQLPHHDWFRSLPAGERFAVRSSGLDEDSAGRSFAGIHETRLNVDVDRLVDAVLACRHSACSDQAHAYRRARAVDDDDVRIGVLVQRMVSAMTSGVAFTMNPVTGAAEIVIDAAPGLGEALVSGRVDPDEFTVRKADRAVVSSRPGMLAGASVDALSLARPQLDELTDLALRLEQFAGAPQDVEWCHDGVQFWIVQSRPITTHQPSNAERTRPPEALAPPRHGSGPTPPADIEWTRANLLEVLPEQTSPQVIAAYDEMLNRAQRKFMGRLLAPDAQLGPMFKVFCGRMYMNLSQMRRVAALVGAPAADLLRSLGHPEQIQPEDEIARRAPLSEVLRCLPDFVRIGSYDARARRLLRRHEARTRDVIVHLTSVDPRTLQDRDIWNAIDGWIQQAPDAIQIVFVMSCVLLRETAVRKACQTVGFSYERLVYPQLAAGERSVSTRQATDLVTLAEVARHEAKVRAYLPQNDGTFTGYREALAGTMFLDRFERFLDQYGHRGRYESDWALPRLHEDPAPALFAIRGQLKGKATDLRAVAQRQAADAAAAWRAFEARLTIWQRWTLLPLVRTFIRRLKKQYVWREQVRSDLTRIVRFARQYHLVLADRFVERGWIDRRDDYFLLRLDEIGPVIADPQLGPALAGVARRRAAEMAMQRNLRMPLLMHEAELHQLLRESATADVTDDHPLTGLCVSPGSVEAEIIVLRDPSEFVKMKRGAILVAPATDPSWTPLFTLASGVIVEVGGMLSHASTIAREYGLPALANVKHATTLLTTGERVRLDASGGRVVRRGS